MTSNHSKRRKIAGDAPLQATACPIYNLFPAGVLKEVANFLEAPSRVLFAIAVEPPSSPYNKILARCQPNLSRSLITGYDWRTLDFCDIEKELAAKLTDEDVSKILLHIDAAHKVKRLLLTNCTSISGACLAALRHSTSIEQIDMSLVTVHESPELDPAPQLSCNRVLPILRSIINQERNSLKHLQFPNLWRDTEYADDSDFVAFLKEYNEMMGNRGTTFCKKCNRNISMGYCMDTCEDEYWFAVQDHTCCVCTNNLCYRCNGDYNHYNGASFCHKCQRRYCSKCSTMEGCGDCDLMYCASCTLQNQNQCASPECMRTFCNDCRSYHNCQNCGKIWCGHCLTSNPIRCDHCNERCCAECSEKEGTNGVYTCGECMGGDMSFGSLCDKCRVSKCKVDDDCCKSCAKIVSALILKENRQLHDETKSLREEIKVLKEESKGLKNENKKMRNDISTAKIFLNKY